VTLRIGTTAMTPWRLASLLASWPLAVMLMLMVVEAALSAGTTWLVIRTGRDVANDQFVLLDLLWILLVQSTSYGVGAISWIYAERAGFGAYGRYMHRFAQANRGWPTVLADRLVREKSEPFLTGESFHIYFELMYEMESALRVFLALVFNALVLGLEIDGGLPLAYGLILFFCVCLQYAVRVHSSRAYAQNQKKTNRLTAHSYTAWDNIFSGNRYNYRLWNRGFKQRLREALAAQIKAIMVRESLGTAGGIVSLSVVFGAIAWVAWTARGDTATLVALAATLPRQIELAHSVLGLSEGVNDLLAIWTRLGGAADHFHHTPDANFDARVKPAQLSLRMASEAGPAQSAWGESPITRLDWHAPQEALAAILSCQTGRINVRGANGSGKSSLLALLKQSLGARAFYWPTTDRLAFEFSQAAVTHEAPARVAQEDAGAERDHDQEDSELHEDGDEEAPMAPAATRERLGFSAGEWQIKTLEEIVANTQAEVYLLDEWDANLDPSNRARAEALISQLAARARVVEISHRDAGEGQAERNTLNL
jgi:hypothetical protein